MSKHTPGDWYAKKTAGDHDQYLIYPESGETVAIVNGEANAELIVAAPDLLEVAVKLVEAADNKLLSERHRVIEIARAAIAKAQPTNEKE